MKKYQYNVLLSAWRWDAVFEVHVVQFLELLVRQSVAKLLPVSVSFTISRDFVFNVLPVSFMPRPFR